MNIHIDQSEQGVYIDIGESRTEATSRSPSTKLLAKVTLTKVTPICEQEGERAKVLW